MLIKDNKLKVYTVGFGNDGEWIDNSKEVRFLKEADILIMPGGGDWNTQLYKEPRGSRTGIPSSGTDNRQRDAFYEAVEDNKYIIGICRGFQGISVFNGTRLTQHVNNHAGTNHTCYTYDNQHYEMNSLHHQMVYPWDLEKDEFNLLSWTLGLSDTYLNGWDEEIEFPEEAFIDNQVIEPEMIWYPETRSLGIQGHP